MQLHINEEYRLEEQTLLLQELTIGEQGKLTAPEGKVVLMTVNHVFMDPVPGTYTGEIVLSLADAVEKIGEWENHYRSAVYVDGTVVPEKSAAAAVTGKLDANMLSGGSLDVQGHLLNGVTVVDGSFTIDGVKLNHDGNGGDDFQLWGTAVAVWGNSDVVIRNTEISTKGVVTTAVAAGADARVVVMDSVINSVGTDNTGWYAKHPHLSETPWVLGIRGTLRATNVLDRANVTYYNCDCTCNGWGVLSTDGTQDAVHNIINTKAVIPEGVGFSSGYGAYILGGVTSTFLGAELEVPDFCLSVGGNNRPIVVGASSQENLAACGTRLDPLKKALGGSFASVENRNSVIRSPRFIGMWHHVASEPCTFLPGTVLEAGDTAFLIKSGGPKVNGPEIICDTVNMKTPCIVHLMETDDAGMGVRTHDQCWAPCMECWPANPAAQEGYDAAAAGENDAHICLKHMTVSGDCWNTRISGGQNLCVELTDTRLTGMVSSGIGEHRRYSYGLIRNADGTLTCTDLEGRKYITEKLDDMLFGKMPVTNYVPQEDENGAFVYDPEDSDCYSMDGHGIYYKDPQYVADMKVTAGPTVNNGVWLKLSENSTWTATGECWLSVLEMDETSSVLAPAGKTLCAEVDGVPAALTAGRYTGMIHITLR